METILTILGYMAVVLQWIALYVGLPLGLLYILCGGVFKPAFSLFRKKRR